MQFLKSSPVETTTFLLIETVGDRCLRGANQVLRGDDPSRKEAASQVGLSVQISCWLLLYEAVNKLHISDTLICRMLLFLRSICQSGLHMSIGCTLPHK